MESIFSPAYFIHLTSQYIKNYAQQTVRELGNFNITPEQYGILFMLSKEDGLYQRQFSKALMKDRPNITRMLDVLEKKKLVERAKEATDKRISKVYITKAGRKFVEETEPVKQKIREEIVSPLSKDEQETLMVLLEKIRNNMEKHVQIQI